jgi:glucosamine--fructose-6-phosphate aminotransferase (isomerizing)
MCGIFGYIGYKTNAASMIFEGLKGLEYRGYDSWGISVKVDGKIAMEKHTGKIGNTKIHLPESSIGIGHTRWATHGGVTIENAHPHMDCTEKIAVLHNGIIENFQELRDELLQQGHTFSSQTDTEVVPHMIEEYMKTEDFPTAVRLTFSRLQGLNAIVAVHTTSEAIVGAKNGSPLVVGIGEGEFFIASDAVEIVKYTNKVIFIEDHQMAVLDKKVKLYSLPEGKEVKLHINTLDWKFEQSEKGKYKHFLIKEISEQPRVVKTIALNSKADITRLSSLIHDAFGTFILGCGTSSYAALAGTYLFSSIAKKHVNFAIGSEFSYLEDYLTDRSLVIPISQSGETIDIVEPVGKAKVKKHAKIAAITNVLGSTLYRMADVRVLLNAGPEKAVIGTKSFIAMIAILILTAYTLAGKFAEGQKILLEAEKDIEEILSDGIKKRIQELAKKLIKKEHVFILGRGISYATALEASLKLKETAYIHAEGFAGGELKHGVISLVEKGTPCIFIAPNDKTYDEIISNAQEVKSRGGFIIGIGPKENSVFDVFLKTADSREATIISQVVIIQLLAYELALARGIEDPDKPRNLAKSVTVK